MNNDKSKSYTPWKKNYLHFKQTTLSQATETEVNSMPRKTQTKEKFYKSMIVIFLLWLHGF